MLRLIPIIVAALACWTAAAADLTGRASVIDGDTIEIHSQRTRLFGIDAPESRQACEAGGYEYRCGQLAALALADHVGRQVVACEPRDTDRYRRIVAICRAGGEDLNAWLVSEGWALAYRHYSATTSTRRTPPTRPAAASGRGNSWRRGITLPPGGGLLLATVPSEFDAN